MKRVAMALLATVAVARAQETAPPTAPEKPDPNLVLSKALRGPQTATDLVVTAKVKHEPPKDGGMFGGAAGGPLVVTSTVLGHQQPFEGTVEACRTQDGSRYVVSRKLLPGFELYLGEGGTIERTTFAEERFSLAQLKAELGPLLDPGAFALRILDAKLPGTREGTKWVFQGEVSKDIVHPTIGMDPMTARVLRVRARLTVDEKGRLEQAAVTVIRNDPMREMMRGQKGLRIQFGGPGAPQQPQNDDDKKHDIEGGSTTYTLTFETREPSQRIRDFQRYVARLNDTR